MYIYLSIYIHIYIYIYIHIYIYDTHNAQIPQKLDERNIYVV